MKSLWSIRWLRPWLFRRWERRRRSELEASPSARPALAVGEEAPAFELPDDAGRPRRFDEWIGRGDAVVWFTNLCAVCADQARALARARLTVPIVAIHHPSGVSSPPSEFRRRTAAEFPILIDDGSVGRTWTGAGVPDT